MGFDDLTQEQQIMVTMRKVLTNIVKEITPEKRGTYPLSDQTVEDIRMCLKLIVGREKELAEEQGITNLARPYYVDEPQTTKTVPLQQFQYSKKIH